MSFFSQKPFDTIHVEIMTNAIHTKMSEGRRVAIPAEFCQRYGLRPGEPVVLEATATGIVVRPLDAVMRDVQAFFADIAAPGGSLSDELIRDRREEAAREDRG